MKQQPWEAGERPGRLLRGVRTTSFVIYKPRGDKRPALMCHARPGNTRKEAWDNAVDATKASRKEFRAAGWTVGRAAVEVLE